VPAAAAAAAAEPAGVQRPAGAGGQAEEQPTADAAVAVRSKASVGE
jgi:hypothetical protein